MTMTEIDETEDRPLPPIQLDNPGRMIASSLTMYRMAHKGHEVVRNGGLYVKSRGHLWSGDLDLTRDAWRLEEIANELKENIYVLRESDYKSEGRPVSEIPWDLAVKMIEWGVDDTGSI